MRTCGILLPVTSLPSPYGIGCFGKEAYRFVDQLKEAGQHYWQILPLGPTGYGDSPYQSFSTFAGNTYLIDLDTLVEQELLTKEECEACDFGSDPASVDYTKMYLYRRDLLYKAFLRSDIEDCHEFKKFCHNNKWLYDYAMYMEIKQNSEEKGWNEWEEDLRVRKPETLTAYGEKYSKGILFHEFLQYEFYRQWMKLKQYANDSGIEIIGDIPIYVSFDSADAWAQPELFQFDENRVPIEVAGCPPDGFSETGQLWGNPLYDWDYHKRTGYKWWIQRIEHCRQLYDVLRIDHFRGFDEYYSIPYGDLDARNGRWNPGPGYDIFGAIGEAIGSMRIIAEDLGYVTESVKELVKSTGYPGMKLLQFAFDTREAGDYYPYNYDKNSVVYTGTHDNNTICGWYKTLDAKDRAAALAYMGRKRLTGKEIAWEFIRLAQAAVSDICIIPMQDYLGLGSEARINTPSVLGDNWKWRLLPGQINGELLSEIRQICRLYGRQA